MAAVSSWEATLGECASDGEASERDGGSCSPGADVSESGCSCDFSGRGLPAVSSSSAAAAGASSGAALLPAGNVLFWEAKSEARATDFSGVETMKERFAKLLLGEDMSGSGQGVCIALAISNAITNLSASVFGELWRLEPLAPQKKAMWRREMEWLLTVSDHIVELIPSIQEFPGGGTFEVMVSRPRTDLHINLPALKKLDDMLLSMLDAFGDTEFWYVDRGILVGDADDEEEGKARPSSSYGRPSSRQDDKWWLPCPRVPPSGLSQEARKKLQLSRDCANQILKAAMAINNGVLAEMEIPDVYYETLHKNGRSCLGDTVYRYITADQFSPECLMNYLGVSSEQHTLEIVNRIEAAIHVWRLKGQHQNVQSKLKKSSWSEKVKGLITDTERYLFLAQRAEGLLQSLRLHYPNLPQTTLDMNKIQHNKDVGQSILESYSRVMESLAFNIAARIDDLIFVDDATKKYAATEAISVFNREGLGGIPVQKRISPSPFSIQNTPYPSPFATPALCSATPIVGSPLRMSSFLNKGILEDQPETKVEKPSSCDAAKLWSYTGNLSARKDAGDAPERD